jgi:hypothetical protein
MAYGKKILGNHTSNLPSFASARLEVGWADTAEEVPVGDIRKGYTTIPRRLDFLHSERGGTYVPRHPPTEHLNFPRLVIKARARVNPINRLQIGERIAPNLGSVLTELNKLWAVAPHPDAGEPDSQFRKRLPRLILETGLNAPETLIIPDGRDRISGVPTIPYADGVCDWLGLIGFVHFWLGVAKELSDPLNTDSDGLLDWLKLKKKITRQWQDVQPTNWYTFGKYSKTLEHIGPNDFAQLAHWSAIDGYQNPADDPDVQYSHWPFIGLVKEEFYRLVKMYTSVLEHAQGVRYSWVATPQDPSAIVEEGVFVPMNYSMHSTEPDLSIRGITPQILREKIGKYFLEEFYERANGSLRFAFHAPPNVWPTAVVTVQCGMGVWVLAELAHLFGGIVRVCGNAKCTTSFTPKGKTAYCSKQCKRASEQRAYEKRHPGRWKTSKSVTNP